MASYRPQRGGLGRDEILPLQFLSPPSDGAESYLDRDSTHSDDNLNMKNEHSPD